MRNSVSIDITMLESTKRIKDLLKDMETDNDITVQATYHTDRGFGRMLAVGFL